MLTTCIAAAKDGGGKITMGEGAALLEKLEAAELEAWMKDRVVELIQECTRASADGAAEAKLQPPQASCSGTSTCACTSRRRSGRSCGTRRPAWIAAKGFWRRGSALWA